MRGRGDREAETTLRAEAEGKIAEETHEQQMNDLARIAEHRMSALQRRMLGNFEVQIAVPRHNLKLR